MDIVLSLQRAGRVVEVCVGRGLTAATMWLVAAAILLLAGRALAVEPLSPVKLGEEPIFERPSPLGDISYTPGRGLRLGTTGLTLGGYASLTASRLERGTGEVELQDISWFVVWDPTPRLHVFSELEYSDAFRINQRGRFSTAENALTADRLYADFTLTDLLSLRTGIFRTPVGRWNVIHATPLVWTTEQPLVTELPFDPNLTGVMLFGSIFRRGGVFTYSIYDQFAGPLEGNPQFDPAQHSAGGRLEYTADTGWSVGCSYLAALRHGNWRHLGGLDLLWTHGRFELSSELVVEDGRGGAGRGGGFLQSVFGLTDRWFLVGRFEHYKDPDFSANLGTLGVVFRPVPAVALKAEYVFGDHDNDDIERGFHASIATLF